MSDDAGDPGVDQETAASADAKPSRPAGMNGRKVTAILALMICLVPLSIYAYNLERNISARRTLTKVCPEIRAARDARLSSELVTTLFESDAPFVREALQQSVDLPCNEAMKRLDLWRWNIRMRYALPRDPVKTARLNAALERAKHRCPQIMMQAFAEMPGHVDPARSAQEAAEACAPLEQAARELSFIPEERYDAWEWSSRMAAVARSLEAADAPHR